MKKFATFTTMAFLLATAGAFAQTPSTPAPGDKAPAKTSKPAKSHKAHKKTAPKTGSTTTTPEQK